MQDWGDILSMKCLSGVEDSDLTYKKWIAKLHTGTGIYITRVLSLKGGILNNGGGI